MINQIQYKDGHADNGIDEPLSIDINERTLTKKTLSINRDAKAVSMHEYDLIQCTPHIHFQHDEDGACLRASEVKPKLDKFIREFCMKNKIELPDNCYLDQPLRTFRTRNGIKSEHKVSLNYKMQIFVKDSATKQTCKIDETWGYLGKDKESGVFYRKGLKLFIIGGSQSIKVSLKTECKNIVFSSLFELIDYVLPAFFILNCFGARSSKGFGSYGIETKEFSNWISPSDKYAREYLSDFSSVYYVIRFPGSFNEEGKNKIPGGNMLNYILTLSCLLKSGFNGEEEDADYYKGRIFRYFSKRDIGSDKAFIKKNILNNVQDMNQESMDHKEYSSFLYTRAVLGLTSKISFEKGVRQGRSVFIEDAKLNKVRDSDKEIKDYIKINRFNNPIHFIPNGNFLIVLPTKIPTKLSRRKFHLIEKKKKKGGWEIVGKSKQLFTPLLNQNESPESFSLERYIDWFIIEYNNQTDMRREDGKFKEPIKKLSVYNEGEGYSLPSIIKVKRNVNK